MSVQPPKRSWKLQEFVAHVAQVNCLALGHRSGRVLVTGGEDKKVNLWAVGKPNCIMSLSGHSTPVECVRFGHKEELVCAGSQAGTLKIWDLEAARLVRTHTGHKAGVSCIEFHPYGEYLASGSQDTCLKLWDTRRKGCIFSYKGHANRVNALKFSPDGQWIASAGEEGTVKLWDLRAGKLMNEFTSGGGGNGNGGGPIYDVEFHPHEFLLAGANKDRTVSFWDLEKFALIGESERETGPVRRIYFHPEGECLFSGTADGLHVLGWEPSATFDTLAVHWGRIADLATASQQLIGASYHQSHVSLFVVDLKRMQPFSCVNIAEKEQKLPQEQNSNVTFRPGQTVRRSFVKEKPEQGKRSTQMKISEETSDKSGTEGEDSDAVTSHADIPDIGNYQNVFQPRNRQLNRTPPPAEPFEDPAQEDIDMPLPVRAVDPMNFHASKLNKKVSPSPTRRASQPSMPSSAGGGVHSGARRGSITTVNNADVMKPQEVHLRNNSHNQHSQRPNSVYEPMMADPRSSAGRANSQSVPRELPSSASCSPVRAGYRTAVNLNSCKDSPEPQEYLPPGGVPAAVVAPTSMMASPLPAASLSSACSPVPYGASPVLKPVSPSKLPVSSPLPYHPASLPYPVQGNTNNNNNSSSREVSTPLDRPTAVRPHRASESSSNSNHATGGYSSGGRGASGGGPHQHNMASAESEKVELVPSISDRPTGLNASDFLPQKFGGLKIGLQSAAVGPNNHGAGSNSNKLGYDWPQPQYSESEVTSSILKDHTNIMAVVMQRSRNLEIVRQLWHSKDAKTAVEQAVDFNDPAVVVDLISVIVLRPSIWNLDLCLILLPPIGELLLSKYESHVTGAASALKLILKNFGTVIKSNIDTPMSNSVGVDISKEERLNKCLDCYRELVKIRSTILKRQTLQGKCGHAFRELAILMQCLD